MLASHRLGLDLRPATLDDVEIVANLEATRDPEDPRDPEMLRFWWTNGSLNEVYMRLVSVRQGEAAAFVINREMGYRLVAPVIELPRDLEL
jgi:hypothetical protein